MNSEHDRGESDATVLHWPPSKPPAAPDAVAVICDSCDQKWSVHRILAGHSFSCLCGSMVSVSGKSSSLTRLEPPARPPAETRPAVQPPPLPAEITAHRVMPADLEMAPEPVRLRSKNRLVIELVLVVSAFIAPSWICELLVADSRAIYLPLLDLGTALLVLIACIPGSQHAFAPLRIPRARYFVEAIAIAAAAALAALAMTAWVESHDIPNELRRYVDVLGLPMAIFVFGFAAAILEEIAFRGLIYGRTVLLFGVPQGILLSGAAFALAHGVTIGLPFHVFLGLYLGYLRYRSGSLYPCMLLHFVYNTVLVVSAAGAES